MMAADTGHLVGTDPVQLVQESGSQKKLPFFCSVSRLLEPKQLRGFALCVLRLESLVREVRLLRQLRLPGTYLAAVGPHHRRRCCPPAFKQFRAFRLIYHPPHSGLRQDVFRVRSSRAGFSASDPRRDGWLAGLTGIAADRCPDHHGQGAHPAARGIGAFGAGAHSSIAES